MSTLSYKRGYSLEWKTKKLLEGQGYMVMRSPASKSESDLIAFDSARKFLIQCKKTGKKGKSLYIYRLGELMRSAQKHGAKPLLVYSFYYSPIYAKEVTKDSEILRTGDRHVLLEKLLKLDQEFGDYIAR